MMLPHKAEIACRIIEAFIKSGIRSPQDTQKNAAPLIEYVANYLPDEDTAAPAPSKRGPGRPPKGDTQAAA